MRKQYLAISCFIFGTLSYFGATFTLAAPFAYVANAGSITGTASGTVSVIDLATNAITATITAGMYPVGSAVSQTRSLVYFTNYNSRTVSVISVATNTVVATVPVLAKPTGIAVSPAGTRVYVALIDGTVSVIDALTNSVIANFLVGTSSLQGIVVDPSGKFAYVADFNQKMIRVIDLVNLKVAANIALTGNPNLVAIHPSGRFVYVTTVNGVQALSVIDTATNALVATINTPPSPQGVAVNPAGTLIYVATTDYVANTSSIVAISAATNTIVGSVPTAPGAFVVGFHPNGGRAYVVNDQNGTVLAVDTASLAVVATIPVGVNAGTYGEFIVACAAGQVFSAGSCAAPAAQVVEYINTLDFPQSPGGHFFYTDDPAEQSAVDAGAAGRFSRTGNSFKPGGTKQLCRFFGSIVPGPNSHFFTINDAECKALRAAQVIPTPTSVQQWNYEGLIFSETPPNVSGAGVPSCPSSTVPVYRYYNNAFRGTVKNPWDSNHRYGTDKAGLDTFAAANNWAGEGIVFCAAP